MRKALWFGIGLATGVLLTMFLIVAAVEAAEPAQAAPHDTNWANLARLPGAAPVVVEDIDGKWHRGRLLAVADDALSLAQRKRVRGIPRERIERIWLLGDRQTKKGAAIGAITLGLMGGLTGGIAYAGAEDDGGMLGVMFGFALAGVGAGVGAAIGAGIREQRLIYRAPPSGHSPPTPRRHSGGHFSGGSTSCGRTADTPLPAPLQDVCQVFGTEEAAQKASEELAGRMRRKEEWR